MIVLSRDGAWLSRLENIALRGGWPFEARAAIPAPGRTPPPERALVVLDRALAGASVAKSVAALRALYPAAAIAFACDEGDLDAVAAAVDCGADEVLGKTWPEEKLAVKLFALRDRALGAQTRVSADGALKAERRSHRALIRVRGKWSDAELDAAGFALLWRLLEREGEPVARAELGAAIAAVSGRERELGTVARRLSALKKTLAKWPGRIESARGGVYRLSSKRR
ncbi:MAG: hypothetical protein M0D55_19340 [Elusimicrobiota bacterium]|nr:MAG: hypothetical protein M0D55_19340 [Elusimicrobiota bacterium]